MISKQMAFKGYLRYECTKRFKGLILQNILENVIVFLESSHLTDNTLAFHKRI